MLGLRPPAGKVMTSSTHRDVQIIIEHIISSYTDSSDGRVAEMLSVGRGFKTCSKLKCEKLYFVGYM